MSERIASGEIRIDIEDKEAIAALHHVDEEFSRTMRKISHEKAVAEIQADMADLEDKVAKAKRKIKEIKGQKAEAKIDANTEALDRKLLIAQRALDRWEGRKATAEMRLKGAEKTLASIEAVNVAEDRLAKARQKRFTDENRIAQASERRAIAARRQMLSDEKAAYAIHRQREVGIHQETARVITLQRQYAKLTDQLERLSKKRPIGREARAKVTLDAAHVISKMEALKAELNFLGGHPPVDIKADVNRKGVVNKFKGVLSDLGTMIGNKAAGLSDLTMRLGPFTGSIKQFAVALSFLGPTITDLLGAAGALVGVLGAGIAGAATMGAGALTGMASAGLGFMFATRNTRQELTQARTSISAYQNAILKYGKNSDKAKAKQKEMNSVLKQISPLARETALGVEDFYKKWDNSTKTTQKNLGTFAKRGFQALGAIRPVMAHQTNELSGMLSTAMGGVRDFFKGEGKGLLSGITQDFDRSIPHLLHGLGSFGHAFLLFGREGARHLGLLTGGFDKLGGKLLAFTQRDTFGDTVKKWVGYAHDITRLFGAAGRVLMHFFGAGEKAGDGLVKSMTAALNKWDKFLSSDKGHDSVANAFNRAASGAKALWNALAPLAGSFVMWANNLSPFVTGILKGIGFVSKLVGKLTELTGLAGPLGTLGATVGAMWAVGKIGAFVSMLARAVGLMRELGAMKTVGALLSGKFFGMLKGSGGAGIAEAGTAAAAEMRAAILQGGAGAAAEMRAAMGTGGAIGAAERGAGGLILPRGAGGAVAREGEQAAAAAGGFGMLESAVGGVGAAFGITSLAGSALATGGLALVAGAAVYGAYKLITMKSSSEKLHDSLKQVDVQTKNYSTTTKGLIGITNALGQSTYNYNQSVKTVSGLKKHLNALEKSGKKNTDEYRQTLQQLNQALEDRSRNYNDAQKYQQAQNKAEKDHTVQIRSLYHAQDLQAQAEKKLNDDRKSYMAQGMRGKALDNALSQDKKDLADATRRVSAAEKAENAAARAATLNKLNYNRALKGLIPLAGRAATAMVNLAKRAPNMAQTISVKYADPKDAANVARRASAALKSGVKSSIVAKIIADSSDAEEAIRRINHMEVKQKVLNIKEKGGAVTMAKLEQITGHHLGPKTQRILEKGGDAALHKLKQILGFHISDKSFRAWLKTNAPGLLSAIQAGLAGLHDKTITLTTINRVINSNTGALPGKHPGVTHVIGHRASGRGPIGHETALVGEGRKHEFIADHRTGTIRKTDGPAIMALKPSESVIPTEAAHKATGRALFMEMAKDLGIPGFKGARKAKHHRAPKLPSYVNRPTGGKKLGNVSLSAHGRAHERHTARTYVTKHTKGHGKSGHYIEDINTAKQAEDDQNFEISRAEGKLKEPDTFLKKIGRDPVTGDDLFAIDDSLVKAYAGQLDHIRQMYDDLLNLIRDTEKTIHKAEVDIPKIIAKAHHNMSVIAGRMKVENAAMTRKGASKSERDAAGERYRTLKGMYDDEKQDFTDAKTDRETLPGERHDLGQRRETATDSRDQYASDRDAVQGSANTELAGTIKEPDFTPPQTPLEAAQGAIPALDAEAALAAIGQGIGGQPPRSQADINADRVHADQHIIDVAKGMLTDTDPTNDQDAYAAITSASQDIASLTGDSNAGGAGGGGAGGAGTQPSGPTEAFTFATARDDLYKQFSNNFSLAATIGRGNLFGGPGGGNAGPGGGGRGVYIENINVPTTTIAPDPHTLSKQIGFELQASL